MRDSLCLRFLYNTFSGRAVLKILLRPSFSKIAGRFLDSRLSRFLIPRFQHRNHISLEGIQIPDKGFMSFNEFFTRKKETVQFSEDQHVLSAPCDAFLSCYTIDSDRSFSIKHSRYNIEHLLDDKKLAQAYEGGTAMIFRLTPAHYHRFHFVDDAQIMQARNIQGKLHCVRPIALEKFPVYIQNTREYVVMKTANLGQIIQMEIGALLVGRIKNHPMDCRVKRGEEKGCFEFGGSTIVLLLQKDAVDCSELKKCMNNNCEIPVKLGEKICFCENTD